MPTIILLAAGLSRRMGAANKLLLPIQGQPMIAVVAQQLVEAQIGDIVAVTGHESQEVSAALAHLPIRIVENLHYATGMTTSIQAGVQALSTTTDGYMICLGDMPLMEAAEYRLLASVFACLQLKNPKAIVQPTFGGQRGNPVIFAADYRDEILTNTDPEGCKPIVKAHRDHVYLVEMPTHHILRDIDVREEYEQLT